MFDERHLSAGGGAMVAHQGGANGAKYYTKEVAKKLNCTTTTVRSYYKDSRFHDPSWERRGKQKIYYLDEERMSEYIKICAGDE